MFDPGEKVFFIDRGQICGAVVLQSDSASSRIALDSRGVRILANSELYRLYESAEQVLAQQQVASPKTPGDDTMRIDPGAIDRLARKGHRP